MVFPDPPPPFFTEAYPRRLAKPGESRRPSRTPSPRSTIKCEGSDLLCRRSVKMDHLKAFPQVQQIWVPSSNATDVEAANVGDEQEDATPREVFVMKKMKLIFCEGQRGLPSLHRGWRTPDPSPSRTGLPKCAAPREYIVEELDDKLVCVPCTHAEEATPVPCSPQSLEPNVVLSQGSIGHPDSCSEACKYASRARGCKDGADCDRCHLCEWKRPPKKSAAKKQALGQA
jgi:hypothetical protein